MGVDYSQAVTGEFGVFYSDADADHGVSAACLSQRAATTDAISPFDTNTDVRSKLRSLSNYISDVTVTRTHVIDASGSYTTNAGGNVAKYLQYEWQITFITSNGDVNPLTATSSLSSTTTGSAASRPGTSSGAEPETEAELRLRLASAESVMRKLYRRTNDLEERLQAASARQQLLRSTCGGG